MTLSDLERRGPLHEYDSQLAEVLAVRRLHIQWNNIWRLSLYAVDQQFHERDMQMQSPEFLMKLL